MTESWDLDFDLGDDLIQPNINQPGQQIINQPIINSNSNNNSTNNLLNSLDDFSDSDSDSEGNDIDDDIKAVPVDIPSDATQQRQSAPSLESTPRLPTGNDGKALVGISADPTMREAWDDDFDLALEDNDTASISESALMASDESDAPMTLATFENMDDVDIDGFGDTSSSEEENWDAEMGLDANGDEGALDDMPSSDEEDWDAEFDDDDGDTSNNDTAQASSATSDVGDDHVEKSQFTMHLGMIRNLIRDEHQSSGLDQDRAAVPRRYRLLDAISGSAAQQVVRYPPPCETYSVHPTDGFKRMGSHRLAEWLTNIAESKVSTYLMRGTSKRRASMVGLNSRRRNTQKLQAGWSDTYLREAWAMFRNPDDHGKLWILLTDYFETLSLLHNEIQQGGGNLKSTLKNGTSDHTSRFRSTGWDHVFQNSLSLLRLGCRARQSMHTRIDNNDGSWYGSGGNRGSNGGSSSSSSGSNRGGKGDYRRMASVVRPGKRSSGSEHRKRSVRRSIVKNIDDRQCLMRSRYSRMLNVLHETFPQFKLSVDIEEVRVAAHILSSTTSYLVYIHDDGNVDAISESEENIVHLEWKTPPKYLEARVYDEDDEDETRAGMEIIAKLCESIASSSTQMVEKGDGSTLHPLMQRLHTIAAEAGGDVTYTAVKAILVSEFSREVFEQHKTTVRWDLEHMAHYVTEEVDSELAKSLESRTMSDRSMTSKISQRRMLSSSLHSRKKNGTSQLNLLLNKSPKNIPNNSSGIGAEENSVVMGLPPWKRTGSCLEGSLLYVQVAALTSLQCLLNGRSPLTGIEDEGLADALPAREDYKDTMWSYSKVNTPILGLLRDIDNPHLIQKIDHPTSDSSVITSTVVEPINNDAHQAGTTKEIMPSSSSPPARTKKRRSSLSSMVHNRYIEYEALHNGGDYQTDSYRIEILMPGYIALPPHCLLKAQAALVIGTHFLRSLDKEDWVVAERILYECVYCLDELDTKVEKNGILSEFGIEALVTFADALCKNGKYAYGILAYEAAIKAYKVMTGTDFQKMTRRLSIICRENRDMKRALKYHGQILHGANKDQDNTTEVVYITERISEMQCDMGNFSDAQASLRGASIKLMKALNQQEQDLDRLTGKYGKSNVKGNGKSSSRRTRASNQNEKEDALVRLTSYKVDENAGVMHSHFFTLRKKLAQVFLAKEQLPDAINLLQKVQANLKNGKRDKKIEVQMLLVRCFLRLRDFDECETELNNIQDELRQSHGSSSSPGSADSSPRGWHEQDNNQARLTRVQSVIESLEEDKNRQKSKPKQHHHHRRGAAMESVSIPKFDRGIERIVRSVEYLKLRARNLAYGNQCQLALGWLKLALSVVRPSSLGGLGSLHYLRGKIYQRSNYQHVDGLHLCGYQHTDGLHLCDADLGIEEECGEGTEFQTSISIDNSPMMTSTDSRSPASMHSTDMYIRGVGAFQRASQYFRAVDDNHRQAKALIRESKLHLRQLFIPVQVHHQSLDTVANDLMSTIRDRVSTRTERLKMIQEATASATALAISTGASTSDTSISDDNFDVHVSASATKEEQDPYLWVNALMSESSSSSALLNAIDQPANLAIDLASNVADPMLMMQCLHTISELRCLQGYVESSEAYWQEAYRILINIYLVERMESQGKNVKYTASSEEDIPGVPSTCCQLPAGLVNKLHVSSESLLVILLGLGGEFLDRHASLFLTWHLLDTRKWCAESRLPRAVYTPQDKMENTIRPLSSRSSVNTHSRSGSLGSRTSSTGSTGIGTLTSFAVTEAGTPLMPLPAFEERKLKFTSEKTTPTKTFKTSEIARDTRGFKTQRSHTIISGRATKSDNFRRSSAGVTGINTPTQQSSPQRRRVYTPLSNKKKKRGNSTKGEKLWRHFYCLKTDMKKYSAGVLTQSEVSQSNLKRMKELLSEMKQGQYRKKDTTNATAATAQHQYPATTFFLARVRHQLVYYEPNGGIIRLWNPSQSFENTEAERTEESKNELTAGSPSALPSSSVLRRTSSRRVVSEMMMSNLDSPGFLSSRELVHLLDNHRLVRETEISRCDIGLHYLLQTFTMPTIYQMMSVLLNEMPMVVVSTNPNRLIQVMSSMLSLLRPFRWQHMYAPVIPTSCANIIGGAMDPSQAFFIGCDPSALPVIEGEIRSIAVRSSISIPGITVVQLDVADDGAAKVIWGREFDNEWDATNILLRKMRPITTGIAKESMNPLHRDSSGSSRSSMASAHRRSLVDEKSNSCSVSNTGKTIACVHVPTRYTVMGNDSSNSSSRSSRRGNKKPTFSDEMNILTKADVVHQSMYKFYEDMMALFPLFVYNEDNTFDVKMFINASNSVRPDCERFLRNFVRTNMFNAFLHHQYKRGGKNGTDNTDNKSSAGSAGSVAGSNNFSSFSSSKMSAFEAKFNSSIARQLNIVVAESGMSVNVQKTGYLHVTIFDLVAENDNKPIPEKPLKLKERRRWVVLDRQRLTYFNTRSTKKIKGVITLNSEETRMSIAPPLPVDTRGMVVYTKPLTIKIENDAQQVVLYLRATDDISFREWCQALQTRLMPDSLKQKMKTPYRYDNKLVESRAGSSTDL